AGWCRQRPIRSVIPVGVTNMVVMGAECDIRALERGVSALHDADDVFQQLEADDLIVGVDIEGNLHAFESKRREWLLGCGAPLQLRVTDGRTTEKEGEKAVARHYRRRDHLVKPFRGGEVDLLCSRERAVAFGLSAPCCSSGQLLSNRRCGKQLLDGMATA